MKTISSLTHETVKYLVSLVSRKGREQQNEFMAQGLRVCSTLVRSKIVLTQLYVTHEMLETALTITSEEQITTVSVKVMEKISPQVNPEGIIGLFKIPNIPAWNTLGSGMVLAELQDPGNMGTLIRTAAALNLSSVVIVDGASPWSPKVVQATAGTIGLVNIFQCSWNDLIAHKGALKLHALVVSDGQSLESVSKENALLVIGNEARGLSDAWVTQCDSRITLPMPGNTESLNAAVAGSIAAYQLFTR